MRVNVYAEEMTDKIEIISKEIDGHKFTGLRFYLELPVTIPRTDTDGNHQGYTVHRGPFMHRPGDDDSIAVTFWGKQDLRMVLRKALAELDVYYGKETEYPEMPEAAEDKAFKAFVAAMPEKHWARYDLSAVRLGWDACKALKEKEGKTHG